MKSLQRYLVAGLLVWVPLGVTIFVLKLLVDLMDQTLVLIPPDYRPENVLGFHIPGLGIVLTAAVLLVTGVFAANFFGRHLVGVWESVLQRIPLVRSIYSAAKNFAEIVLSDGNDSFKKVLLDRVSAQGSLQSLFPDVLGYRRGSGTHVGGVRVRIRADHAEPDFGADTHGAQQRCDRARHGCRGCTENGDFARRCRAEIQGYRAGARWEVV